MSRAQPRPGRAPLRTGLLLAALLACTPKAPPGAPPAARASPAAGPRTPAAGDPCGASALGAPASDDPAAAELVARACELSSVGAADPVASLLAAARVFRGLAEQYAARAERGPTDGGGNGEGTPGHSQRDLLARQADNARACAAAAHRALGALLPAVVAALDAGKPAAESFALATAPAAEPLYLEAACGAAWARAQGFTHLVDRRAELQAALERASALDPALDDAGPDRELGRLLSSLPAYAGGSLREARARFDAAVARAPGSVQNRVLYARGVAVKLQDRALFEALLNTALAQPAAEAGEMREAEVARSLLARANDLFGATP